MEPDTLQVISSLASNVPLVLVSSVASLVIYFFVSYWQSHGRWEKYGVKHVHVAMHLPIEARNQVLVKNHGPTVGYSKKNLVLVTTDLDLLKQVLVKDFNNFSNRMEGFTTKSPLVKGVFFLRDYDWKRIRQLMSPSFSTGKLKRISTHVNESANRLSQAFVKCAETETLLKLFHTTGQYATSIIAKTAFGVQADSIGEEEDDQFTYYLKRMFKKRSKWALYPFMFLIRFSAFQSFLIHIIGWHFPDPCPQDTTDYFNAILNETIAERETAVRNGSGNLNNDFLQSLVSTVIASENSQPAENSTSGSEEKITVTPKKTIDKKEIIAQSVLTIFAAYETTASTLQFALFKLAQEQEVQERVFQEILGVIEHDEPTHEELAKLHFMEQVINETLRLFPPLIRITREAKETRTYGDITIPAGAAVEIPIKEIHRDPGHYADPDKFDPDRFNEKNKTNRNPLAFMPFGYGPRLCIGMRLAYLEVKTALVQILRKVKVELDATTVPRKGEDLEMTYRGFPRPKEPIELAVKTRANAF